MRNITLGALALVSLTACYEINVDCADGTVSTDSTDLGDDSVIDTGSYEDELDDTTTQPLENPYAFVGEQHNELLACTMRYDVKTAKDTMAVLMGECGFELDDPNDDFIYSMSNAYIDVSSSLYGTGVNAGLHPEELEILARADVIVRHYEPEEVAEHLIDLEQEALQMDGSEALLSGIATLRASNEFWMDEYDEDQTRAKWWQILLADAGGALIGAAVAGPAGGIALGTTASTLVAQD